VDIRPLRPIRRISLRLTSASTQPPPERPRMPAVGVDDHEGSRLLRRRPPGLDHLADDLFRPCSKASVSFRNNSRIAPTSSGRLLPDRDPTETRSNLSRATAFGKSHDPFARPR